MINHKHANKSPNYQNVNITGARIPLKTVRYKEHHCKIAAEFLLLDSSQRIRIPSAEEWFGAGLLERDHELTRRP